MVSFSNVPVNLFFRRVSSCTSKLTLYQRDISEATSSKALPRNTSLLFTHDVSTIELSRGSYVTEVTVMFFGSVFTVDIDADPVESIIFPSFATDIFSAGFRMIVFAA